MITWLHISDLMIRQGTAWPDPLESLLIDLEKLQDQHDLGLDFIVITGDIANSGQSAEYQRAREFLDRLLSRARLREDRLFIVPGNHDVNRRVVSSFTAKTMTLLEDTGSVNDLFSSDKVRSLVLDGLGTYGEFVNSYSVGSLHFDEQRYFYVSTMDLDHRKVAVLGLNSAWAEVSESELGAILGKPQVSAALDCARDADLKVALMHHPFERLRAFDRRACEPLLTRSCDFILHSYSHAYTPAFRGPEQVLGRTAMVIAAGGIHGTQENGQHYNVVQLDPVTRQGKVFLRAYSDRTGGFWSADTLAHIQATDGVLSFTLRPPGSRSSSKSTLPALTPKRIWLRELDLKNFRCFEYQSFSFHDSFTVLIGDNASGKTTVLEALKLAVGALFLGFDGVEEAPSFELDQVRRLRHLQGESATYEMAFPVQAHCTAMWGNHRVAWSRLMTTQKQTSSNEEQPEAMPLTELARSLQSQVRSGKEVILPVIAYYSTGRVWRTSQALSGELSRPDSRFEGYKGCLSPASHLDYLVLWIKTQEMIALQEKQSRGIYEAVKEAIKRCMAHVKNVYYDVAEGDVYVTLADGQHLPFRMLSEGIRSMFAMVADIARRAAILNPQLGRLSIEQAPGIILIDELDLHLHPKWQQTVVADLARAFPRMQFVATTHSPLLVGGLLPSQVICLARDEKEPSIIVAAPMKESVKGWRADQILTSLPFGLESSIDPETQKLIATYSRLSVRENLTSTERKQLEDAARRLQLRLPSSAEKREAREAYEAIQQALLDRWRQKPPEERKKLLGEVDAQLLASAMGRRRPG